MTKTRAPGGGRKSLSAADKTISRNVTLLSSQVEELTRLGAGNLSKGIRIVTQTYTRRQHVIEAVANQIAYLVPEDAERRNKEGWTVEVRWQDGEYISATDYTRVEGVILSPTELEQAQRLAYA